VHIGEGDFVYVYLNTHLASRQMCVNRLGVGFCSK
jgi:hypothetical protein